MPFFIESISRNQGGRFMFNLDNITQMLLHHGNFHIKLKVIHVGGTNGKGSTSLMIQNILISAGYRVGIYTSPFDMGRFDNININHIQIQKEDVDRLNQQFLADFERFDLSPFEIDTFLALFYMYENHVDYAVIEVGLGGRDDATNVVMPMLSVITNIGLDHQDVLGYGYASVAEKKAGIIKYQVPVVLGHDINHEAFQVLSTHANQQQSNIYQVKPYQIIKRHPNIELMYENHVYRLNTLADYQARNASLAIEVALVLRHLGIQLTDEQINQGISMGVPPKRFQLLSSSPMVIIDGAHNTEGMERLIESIKKLEFTQKIRVIVAILKDKPYIDMIEKLKDISNDIILTTFEHERAMDLSVYQDDQISIEPDYQKALSSMASHPEAIHLITGSLYFLAIVVNTLKGMMNQ
jgi:dihydrofolate synthase / folylpolyglutamate synthase